MSKKPELREYEHNLVATGGMEMVLDALDMTSKQHKLGLQRRAGQQGSVPLDGNVEIVKDHKRDQVYMLKTLQGKRASMSPSRFAGSVQGNIFKLERKKNR